MFCGHLDNIPASPVYVPMQDPTKVKREQLSPPAVIVARTVAVKSPGDAANTCTQFLKLPGNSVFFPKIKWEKIHYANWKDSIFVNSQIGIVNIKALVDTERTDEDENNITNCEFSNG